MSDQRAEPGEPGFHTNSIEELHEQATVAHVNLHTVQYSEEDGYWCTNCGWCPPNRDAFEKWPCPGGHGPGGKIGRKSLAEVTKRDSTGTM